jgi:hypothetical protein
MTPGRAKLMAHSQCVFVVFRASLAQAIGGLELRTAIRVLAGLCLNILVVDFSVAGGWGMGAFSCAEYAKFYAANPTTGEGLSEIWAQGFITGLELSNAANGFHTKISAAAQFPHESFKARINEYCDSYPLRPYSQAVLDFYLSLPINK